MSHPDKRTKRRGFFFSLAAGRKYSQELLISSSVIFFPSQVSFVQGNNSLSVDTSAATDVSA